MSIVVYPYMIKRESQVSVLSDDELKRIDVFKERANDLAVTIGKYKKVPIAKIGKNVDGDVLCFEANTPDVDFVLILAAKFRFFFAEKEDSYFERVANLIRSKATDDWARNYVDLIRSQYKSAMKEKDVTDELGCPVSNENIINLWFNSVFFHSDSKKRAALNDVHSRVGECGSLFQLYTAILHCSVYVERLYIVIRYLTKEKNYIYTPDFHFGQKAE